MPYGATMFTKPYQPMPDLKDDLRTDYALIVIGIGVALTALIYLLLM